MRDFRSTTLPVLSLILAVPSLGGCNTYAPTPMGTSATLAVKPVAATDEERDCLGRAMYFESNRSDAEGLLAVGTVVMNRLEAAAFPNGGICAVVGQPRQFAPGVLTKKMEPRDLQKVAEVTDAVLDGQRHPKVGRAMYFHTAGLRFPYNNMHYVAVAGGNAFYEKRKPGAVDQAAPPVALAFASAEPPAMPVTPAPATLVVPDPVAPTPAAIAQAPVPHAEPASTAQKPSASKVESPKVQTAKAHVARDRTAQNRQALTPAALAPEPPPPAGPQPAAALSGIPGASRVPRR